ncbi:MAG: transcription termination factor Rho [Desulfatitalea sp.]|nr:transcription termination factor Rho [Desulfatitalea sp.]NNK01965.1 transcription termination factor Rho [Desulfatitalea sp.]
MAAGKKTEKEKPLDRMTAIELREVAKNIEGIVGVHGMNKPELLAAIKKDQGIADTAKPKSGASTKELKSKIKALKAQRGDVLAAEDKVMAARVRRKISRLKKKTRRAA